MLNVIFGEGYFDNLFVYEFVLNVDILKTAFKSLSLNWKQNLF